MLFKSEITSRMNKTREVNMTYPKMCFVGVTIGREIKAEIEHQSVAGKCCLCFSND